MGFLVQTGLFLGSGLVRKFVLGSNQIVQFILFSERASNPTFLHVLIFFHRQTYRHTDRQTDQPTKVGLEAPSPELKNISKQNSLPCRTQAQTLTKTEIKVFMCTNRIVHTLETLELSLNGFHHCIPCLKILYLVASTHVYYTTNHVHFGLNLSLQVIKNLSIFFRFQAPKKKLPYWSFNLIQT